MGRFDVMRWPLRRSAALLVLATALAGAALPGTAPAATSLGPPSVADLAQTLQAAVVNIATSQTVTAPSAGAGPQLPPNSQFQDFFDQFFDRPGAPAPRSRRVQSLGSGFVIDPSGIIVTNNHVIEGADEIVANFSDGSKLTAKLVGRDSKADLAVLKVNPQKPLASLRFGDSEKLRVGDWVMAIGNPFGLGGTVTVGILSARHRDINSGPYDDFLQTDAAINRGNSGGPLFNMDGDVIGINTAIISPTGGSIGIGFAIPSSAAQHIVDQIRQFGVAKRGWLGVRVQQVNDDIAEGLGLDRARGALISGVTDSGPAAAGGLKVGDVVLDYDGQAIEEMRDLPRMVANTDIGKDVEMHVMRKGEQQALHITIAALDDHDDTAKLAALQGTAQDVPPKTASIGMKLAELNQALRNQYNIAADVKGVVVTGVEDNSAAAEKGVQAGDVIVEVAQEPVSTQADIDAKIEKLRSQSRRSLLLTLSGKGGDIRFVAVRID